MALIARPALPVADGAMAGLSSSEVHDILQILLALNARGVAVIMITQIMCAVMRFSERVVVLASMIGLSGIPARIASTRQSASSGQPPILLTYGSMCPVTIGVQPDGRGQGAVVLPCVAGPGQKPCLSLSGSRGDDQWHRIAHSR